MNSNSANPACPIPLWAFFLFFLLIEFTAWVALTRFGVARQWWSDKTGGLLLLSLPFVIRLLVTTGSYAMSRLRGMSIKAHQSLSVAQWLRFFCTEYFHLCSVSLLYIPFDPLFRTASERATHNATKLKPGEVIVLQHGYTNGGAVWHSTAKALERSGYRVFAISQPWFQSIDGMAERLHDRIERVVALTGATQVTLVAHSMGGLISRAYLRRYGNTRVTRLITLGTPHHGTHHAALALGTNGAQMRPGNAWLTELNKTPVTVPFTSIYSVHDTIISPQDSSAMTEATNLELHGIGHVAMPSGRATRAHLLQILQRSSVAQRID
ncbi:MAG: alpha/beta fold hydrolase [Burkholderiales bacterium]|nr:MAG: alpha/beta fold hydrolase [Burkholderiales bacterium]TAG45370.1 MAG: alpha/beta fold hydrolase [Betaproteobacteria bacterium]